MVCSPVRSDPCRLQPSPLSFEVEGRVLFHFGMKRRQASNRGWVGNMGCWGKWGRTNRGRLVGKEVSLGRWWQGRVKIRVPNHSGSRAAPLQHQPQTEAVDSAMAARPQASNRATLSLSLERPSHDHLVATSSTGPVQPLGGMSAPLSWRQIGEGNWELSCRTMLHF
jgi:hypothetical protein